MKRKYKLPIKGTVLVKKPLTGARDDPIEVIPLLELVNDLGPKIEVTDSETQERKLVSQFPSWSCICGEYNIDEEWCEVEIKASEQFHNWLSGILPQLRDIQKQKGWRLDKTKLATL